MTEIRKRIIIFDPEGEREPTDYGEVTVTRDMFEWRDTQGRPLFRASLDQLILQLALSEPQLLQYRPPA